MTISCEGVNACSPENQLTDMFSHMFNKLLNLQYLKFDQLTSGKNFYAFSFSIEHPTFVSMSLMKLHIHVRNFDDCLYLLNGSFDHLRVCHIIINFIFPIIKVENKVIHSR